MEYTWNVRTLCKARALGIPVDALDKYKVNIVALQETRWHGEWCISTGNIILFCNMHTHGGTQPFYGGIISVKMTWVFIIA